MSVATLCLLPGLDGTGRMFVPFEAAARAAGFVDVRTIVYPHDQGLDYAALESFVRARLPRETPFVLLAESFSGPVALAIAAEPPAHLRGLVLSTSFAAAPLPMPRLLAWLAPLAPMRPPMSLLSWLLLGRWSTAALRDALRAALDTVPVAVLRARVDAVLRSDLRSARTRMSKIRVPTLCLHADADRLIPASATARLASCIRDARIARVDGPHLLLQTHPSVCADRIAQAFLNRSITS